MEPFETLIISLVGATAFSVTSLALYMISIRSMRRIEVFGPYLFKLDESGKLREVREHIPPEVSEALNKALDKIAQTMRDKFVQKIRERFRIKWYNIIAIAVATFVIAFIVQLIVFLCLL